MKNSGRWIFHYCLLLFVLAFCYVAYACYEDLKPTAVIDGDKTAVCVLEEICFDASGSFDNDQDGYDIVDWEWKLWSYSQNKYIWSDSGSESICESFRVAPGEYDMDLYVKDNEGNWSDYYDTHNFDVYNLTDVTVDNNEPTLCEEVTFTATTTPSGYAQNVTWSAPGGIFNVNTGPTFSVKWCCIGSKTVTATLCGTDKAENVTVVLPNWADEGSGGVSDVTITPNPTTLPNCDINGVPQAGLTYDTIFATDNWQVEYSDCNWLPRYDLKHQVGTRTCIDVFDCNTSLLSNVTDSNNYYQKRAAYYRDFRVDPNDPNDTGCFRDPSTGDTLGDKQCTDLHEAYHVSQIEIMFDRAYALVSDANFPGVSILAVSCDPQPQTYEDVIEYYEDGIDILIIALSTDRATNKVAAEKEENEAIDASESCLNGLAVAICDCAKSKGWWDPNDPNDPNNVCHGIMDPNS